MLPYLNAKDQLIFLNSYFSAENRDNLRTFVELNHDINIVYDCSAGSNATTMLCMKYNETFWRKWAFGEAARKLNLQLEWIKNHQAFLPLCKIKNENKGGGVNYCCYDMEYDHNAVGMFAYIHSHEVENSIEILKSLLNIMIETLYGRNRRTVNRSLIEMYIKEKVDANIRKICESPLLKQVYDYDTLVINGKEYQNLKSFPQLQNHKLLADVFLGDIICDIHGDLTIENIICINNENNFQRAYYLIDPNSGNILDSMFLDFGKLLQSLHGGYEFIRQNKKVDIYGNHIDFIYMRTAAYEELLCFFQEYLEKHFSEKEIKSIYYHEIVNWLRLMPYKIESDKERAAMFYAGLVIVANDVFERFG